eukprot:NODE_6115_length_652_cov_6.660033_g5189_i0.p3 GENE.NODE_6115_length_652_cov_6.660033_g5189_i0~~NODE_6115_length_652_cov_6.660033_g5189_i0.p3  ORF type:complete len:87 (+),score=7.05 NODE_6115_length_652_cov_6.660033_g5189_i0:252-512(+)
MLFNFRAWVRLGADVPPLFAESCADGSWEFLLRPSTVLPWSSVLWGCLLPFVMLPFQVPHKASNVSFLAACEDFEALLPSCLRIRV